VTKRLHNEGFFLQEKIWQRNYYEHVIRDERDYQKILSYIANNPANWSLDEENVGSHRDYLGAACRAPTPEKQIEILGLM